MTYSCSLRTLVWLIMPTTVPHMNLVVLLMTLFSNCKMIHYAFWSDESNYLKPNPDKWHLLLSDEGDNNFIKIGTDVISNSTDEKILGVYFDNKLNFNKIMQKSESKIACPGKSVKPHEY